MSKMQRRLQGTKRNAQNSGACPNPRTAPNVTSRIKPEDDDEGQSTPAVAAAAAAVEGKLVTATTFEREVAFSSAT